MSNYFELKEEIITYLCARTPFIVIKSKERNRVDRLLAEISKELKKEIFGYSSIKKVFKYSNFNTLEDIDDAIEYITNAFKKKKGEIFALVDVNHIENDNLFSRDLLNLIYAAKDSNSTLIVVSGDGIWNRLSDLGMISSLSYPDFKERISQIKHFINDYQRLYSINLDENDIKFAATMLKGFSETQIENILSASLCKNNGLYKEDIFDFTSQKRRIYDSLPNVELIELNNDLFISGLENMKLRLEEKRKIFFTDEKKLKQYDLSYPKGVLLTGIPGCGKSLSAKIIAKNWNLPLYKLNLDTIFNKWVGESERQMKEALDYIDNMSPCIVWIDEIEKSLSVSSDGNDTGKRIIGQFLFWLQESKNRVFLVATANDITKLPPEMFRKGRFSDIFFLDLPNFHEREDVIKMYVHKSLHINLNEDELKELIILTEGFSYADIENAIKEIAQKMIINDDFILSFTTIKDSIKSIKSYAQSNPENVKKCQEWGRERAIMASLERR